MTKIPVIINNRDLYTWPKSMLEKIKTYDEVGEIFILDNGSSYEPLLEWYKTNPCNIIYYENWGENAPWVSGLVDKINAPYYVITDPDLDISNTPTDTLVHLRNKLEKYPDFGKIGLSIEWEIPENTPAHWFAKTYPGGWCTEKDTEDGVFVKYWVDTTFMITNRQYHFGGGAAVTPPYVCRHWPWYYTKDEIANLKQVDPEYYFYLKNCNERSSFKKTILIAYNNFEE